MPTMPSAEMQALRDYVTYDSGSLNQAESTVLLEVTHSNLKAKFMQIRLDKHMSILTVKTKLMTHCGTNPSAMVLQLKDENGQLMFTLSEESRLLGYYSPYNGCILHIIDMDPSSVSANGWLEDTSKVDKYEMSDEAYNKRENTFRKYKEEKLKADPTWSVQKEMAMRRGEEYVPPAKVEDPEHMADEASAINAGDRCETYPGGNRGEVKYVGKIEGLPAGYWVGVQLDEPLGKNDGTAKGMRIFECPPKYGLFLRPDRVKVGDFPPVDEFDDLGSDDEI
ncbi:uncharacterized protein LOC142355566 [Convolutriloba macropyga]|uniref:uncharacterized protein LOC142355566 n=1 Tax=Convolutriloba macropyga TaxID=536237 RepID=UPI003F5278F8